MKLIIKILHFIPFVHFYDKWSDTDECSSWGDDERQKRFCVVCNRKQYRSVNNFSLIK